MNKTFVDEQQKIAREKWGLAVGPKSSQRIQEKVLCLLLRSTILATEAEIRKRVEGMKITDPDTKDHPLNELRNEVYDEIINILT